MNYNNPNTNYPNFDNNYNPNFNANTGNLNTQNFNAIPLCNVCKGSGFYILNGTNVPCQCLPYKSQLQPQNTLNYNMNYTDEKPMRHIEGRSHHHPHHKNIFSRTYQGIKDCISCGGRGFMNAFTNSGHEKVCYDCIRSDGFCPLCENTGFKIHNGKPCKCGLFN